MAILRGSKNQLILIHIIPIFVKTRIALLITGILFSTSLFFSCRKINDATTLGGDLIPVVDNVTTFDTLLSVETYNDLFTDLTDSTRLTSTSTHFAGYIGNDPLFGKTNAKIGRASCRERVYVLV